MSATADEIRRIDLTKTPLDDRTKLENAAELFRAIGIATSSWSRLEVHIDMVLLYLNRAKHSPVIYDKDHPIGFKSKIKLLKRWFNQHPALAHRKIEFRDLAPRFLRLNGIRNEFLHSILTDYNPNTKMAVWRGIKPDGAETYKVALYQGTVDNLILFAAEAHQAHVDFAKIGRDLFESGMIEQLQKHVPHAPRQARRSLRSRGGLVFGRPRRDRSG